MTVEGPPPQDEGKISIIHSHKEILSERILIAGLGKKSKLTSDVIRDVTGIITKKIHELKIREFSIIIPEKTSIENNQIISSDLDIIFDSIGRGNIEELDFPTGCT